VAMNLASPFGLCHGRANAEDQANGPINRALWKMPRVAYTMDNLPPRAWPQRLRASQIADLSPVTLYLLTKPVDKDSILICILNLSWLTFATRITHLGFVVLLFLSGGYLCAFEVRRFVYVVASCVRS
jgi:hypothetical protein